MPRKEPVANPGGTWSNREAYLLALVCLLSGLVLGYLFHGSSSPALNTQVAAQPPAAGAAAKPTAQDLTVLAAPLLAAVKADPNNFQTLVQLGNLYFDHQVYPEAIQYYGRALEIQPNNPNVRTDLGTAYWYSGFPEKAVAEYEKSLAADPKHTNTLFNMGVVRLEGLQDAAGAIQAWEKLLAANPLPPQRARTLELIARARSQLGAPQR